MPTNQFEQGVHFFDNLLIIICSNIWIRQSIDGTHLFFSSIGVPRSYVLTFIQQLQYLTKPKQNDELLTGVHQYPNSNVQHTPPTSNYHFQTIHNIGYIEYSMNVH